MFDTPGCFELVREPSTSPGCGHAHVMVDCPKCKADFMGEIISPMPYRGAVDLKCESCGFSIRVYVDTDTGEVSLLGPRVCSTINDD